MKTRNKALIAVLAILVVSALWVWRYTALNQYYQGLDQSSVVRYQMNEKVPFETDFVEWNVPANGYYISVDGFEILDYHDYMDNAPFELEPMLDSDGIALVHITLRNEDSTDPGIFLSDFCLHGIDSVQGMDWEILTAANPILNGGHGIQLKQGTQEEFVLPFYIRKDSFGNDTWNHLQDYSFYLRVTSFPTQKDIALELTNFDFNP